MSSLSPQEKAFRIGMYWRIGYGLFRAVVGVLLFSAIGDPISVFLIDLSRNELIGHPQDTLLYNLILFFEKHPITITSFFALYVTFWGVVDIVLSTCLLKHKLWAFPFSLVLIASFMVYEIIRFYHTHAVVLLILLSVDTLVFWLIYNEWKRTERRVATPVVAI